MSNIIFNIRHIRLLFLLCFSLTLCSCSATPDTESSLVAEEEESTIPEKPFRDSLPEILVPEATGEVVYSSDTVLLDISNTSKGYLLLTYSGTNEKVKFQIAAPNDVTYTYLVTDYSTAMVYPITGGNGTYTFTLYETVDAANNMYAVAFSESAEVTLENEFLPFLTPNVYANYTSTSASVEKGVELAQNCYCDLDVIENIYLFVTQNISYDYEKAQSVVYGYTPDPDETLHSGKGICFDYASLITTMLRTQRIPTKLEVGYAGEAYHAWISCYVDEIGWVDNIIEFNGESWSLMDPTFAASSSSADVQKYIGDGSRYIVKYTY